MTASSLEIWHADLIDRLYRIERAFLWRRHTNLHFRAKSMPKEIQTSYESVYKDYIGFFEAVELPILVFITIELWARFKSNNKRSLRKFVLATKDDAIKAEFDAFLVKHSEVLDFIEDQRMSFFAHADDTNWAAFPNIWDKEYDMLINDLKQLLLFVSKKLSFSRIPTNTSRISNDTKNLYANLLEFNDSGVDIIKIRNLYDEGYRDFVSSSDD